MADTKKAKRTLADFFRRVQAHDSAIPEELAHDAEEVAEEIENLLADEEISGQLPAAQDNDTDARVDKLITLLEAMLAAKAQDESDPAMKSLDDLEGELNGERNRLGDEENDSDESKTLDETGEASVVNAPEAIKDALSVFKPMIAGIQDASKRKTAADSLSCLCRMQRSTTQDYASIASAATKKAHDAAQRGRDAEEYGEKMAKRYNPHYQKKEGM